MKTKPRRGYRLYDSTGKRIPRCACGRCVYSNGKCWNCYMGPGPIALPVPVVAKGGRHD